MPVQAQPEQQRDDGAEQDRLFEVVLADLTSNK
jgi:hypothetical protein